MRSMVNEGRYLQLLEDVLKTGVERKDRTGVGTKAVFGRQIRYDLTEGFPILTTKEIPFESVLSELLWFIEGSDDERRLAELRYGKSRKELGDKKTIWTANAMADYWKPKALFPGHLGRIYGVQWRSWLTRKNKRVDQLQELIKGLKEDPYGRRHILSAWNPGELDEMALPPCHILCQFYVEDDTLSCQLYQRSADVFLGVPFNIASYALLTRMIAQVCGYQAKEFIHTMGDTHLYLNHIEQAKMQLTRDPYEPPTLWMNPCIMDIEKFRMQDFALIGYESHGKILAEMAV